MKINRQKVYQKYDGHCAYCGVELEFKDMQVDHIISKARHCDTEREENYNPSCRKCNLFKGVLTVEEMRTELSLQVMRLRKNAQFDRALRFGQVQIMESPILFYFEEEPVCEACEGDGVVGTYPNGFVDGPVDDECPECRGKGRIVLTASMSMSKSDDIVFVPKETMECSECKGTGTVKKKTGGE